MAGARWAILGREVEAEHGMESHRVQGVWCPVIVELPAFGLLNSTFLHGVLHGVLKQFSLSNVGFWDGKDLHVV